MISTLDGAALYSATDRFSSCALERMVIWSPEDAGSVINAPFSSRVAMPSGSHTAFMSTTSPALMGLFA